MLNDAPCTLCKGTMTPLRGSLKNGTKAAACVKCDSPDRGVGSGKNIIQLSEENIK